MSAEFHWTFERQCLQAHNKFRLAHCCPPLILCQELTDEANAWAMELSESDNLQHTPNACIGENIYVTRARRITGDVPVSFWYDEIRYYNFDVPKHYFKAIHFTQMIWRNTRRLGVGFAKRGRATIVVVNYDPPGNVVGDFRRNVLPDLYYPNIKGADCLTTRYKPSPRKVRKCIDTEDAKKTKENKETETTTEINKAFYGNRKRSKERTKTDEKDKTDSEIQDDEEENKGSRLFTPFNVLLLLSVLVGVGAIAFIYTNKSR